jgi:hypothetical protein
MLLKDLRHHYWDEFPSGVGGRHVVYLNFTVL